VCWAFRRAQVEGRYDRHCDLYLNQPAPHAPAVPCLMHNHTQVFLEAAAAAVLAPPAPKHTRTLSVQHQPTCVCCLLPPSRPPTPTHMHAGFFGGCCPALPCPAPSPTTYACCGYRLGVYHQPNSGPQPPPHPPAAVLLLTNPCMFLPPPPTTHTGVPGGCCCCTGTGGG
jgi:hypothetical protein